MPEWLTGGPPGAGAMAPELVLIRLLQAACLGVLVAAVYYASQRKKKAEASGFIATLVLLTVLIAMVSQVIGDSVARAFSLVGALSIVRFRTVVDDTRDTAFVIFAVIVGMAAGTGVVMVALLGIPVVGATALLLSFWGGDEGGRKPTLVVRLPIGQNPDAVLAAAFGQYLDDSRLTATGTTKQGASLELTYAVRLKEKATAVALVSALQATDGVTGVEWSEFSKK